MEPIALDGYDNGFAFATDHTAMDYQLDGIALLQQRCPIYEQYNRDSQRKRFLRSETHTDTGDIDSFADTGPAGALSLKDLIVDFLLELEARMPTPLILPPLIRAYILVLQLRALPLYSATKGGAYKQDVDLAFAASTA